MISSQLRLVGEPGPFSRLNPPDSIKSVEFPREERHTPRYDDTPYAVGYVAEADSDENLQRPTKQQRMERYHLQQDPGVEAHHGQPTPTSQHHSLVGLSWHHKTIQAHAVTTIQPKAHHLW